MEFIYSRRKNKLGNTLGFYIDPNTLGAGTIIYHHGSIIINSNAVLGCRCSCSKELLKKGARLVGVPAKEV